MELEDNKHNRVRYYFSIWALDDIQEIQESCPDEWAIMRDGMHMGLRALSMAEAGDKDSCLTHGGKWTFGDVESIRGWK